MAKGGSRYGAGRPSYKFKAELTLALDIRVLHRGGHLTQRFPFTWEWHTNHGQKVGSATIQVSDQHLRLSYTWQGRDFENKFTFLKTPCNYGGVRLWFQCPQCGGRCGKVFFNKRNGYYACRQCVGITYYSQCEDEMDRAWRKQNKLEKKLGKYLMKPKGMQQSTHTRILKKIRDFERVRDEFCMKYIRRFRLENGFDL